MTGQGNLELHPLNTEFTSLYVHVPFCRRKCDYCGFHSSVLPVVTGAAFESVLEERVERTLHSLRSGLAELPDAIVSTVYVGGGTPSCLGMTLLSRLLEGISATVRNARALTEWTVEVNPEDVSPELLDRLRDAGVTRLSLGVQTFDAELRKVLGRHGAPHGVLSALECARTRWKGHLSADLIAGIPGQNGGAAVRDVERLLAFEPEHVSMYALSLETGTPLAARVGGPVSGEETLSGCEATEAWDRAGDRLETAGFERYEVSNFARPGARCVHNTRFWDGRPYLGVGPSAVSTVWAHRLQAGGRGDAARDDAWALRWVEGASGNREEEERLGYRELLQEHLMTRLRTVDGLNVDSLSALFGTEAAQCVWSTGRELQAAGMVQLVDRRECQAGRTGGEDRLVTVTRKGRRFLDQLIRELFRGIAQLDSDLGKW
jgi:oxygen-independent coproporphyrinogen III oxidase